jgi:hypothetical protein
VPAAQKNPAPVETAGTAVKALGPGQYPNLALALAAFQSALPSVRKGQTARIQGKEGKASYSYDYADLTDVSEATLPALANVGLAWTTSLDTHENGSLILVWSLLHGESGESISGSVPVGRAGQDWQSLGSSITYARRYCLVAATGVAPGGDDNDGEGAQAGPPAQRQAQRPVAAAPIPQATGPLPENLYRLSSLDSLEAVKNMYRQARAAGHLKLTIGVPDEAGTVVDTSFEDVLAVVAERFKAPAVPEPQPDADEAFLASAIAAHEAEVAAQEAAAAGGPASPEDS